MGKPTDFNDYAVMYGHDALGVFIDGLMAEVAAARQRTPHAQAQPLSESKPVEQLLEDPPEPPAPNGNASRHDEEWRDGMEVNKDDNFKSSVRNVELVMRFDEGWRGVIAYCDMSYRIVKLKPPPMPDSEAGEWCEEDAAALRVWMAAQYGFTPNHADINDALMVVARSNRFHPVREYLNSLVWDGTSRLKSWLSMAFEATDDPLYLELVGPKILVGAVARVFMPGEQMDNVMILEGAQGKGKSTAIRIMGGEWFANTPIPIGDKEAYQLIQGKWLYEIGELDSFNKAETTAIKQFITQMVDRFRRSYGRYAQDYPRQTQFWGSTNQDVYLRDYTGNRRFWPIYCAVINKDWLTRWRDQLWAEALHLFNTRHETGFQWWVSEEDMTDEEFRVVIEAQDSRLQRDPWEDLLRDWLDNQDKPHLTSAEILMDCLSFDAAHMQQAHMNRLGPIMQALGWKGKRVRVPKKGGGMRQIRAWVRVDNEKFLEDVPL